MTVIAAKWTIEEYHRMVAAGILCDLALGEALRDRVFELLKGEIIEMPRPREPSAYCSDEAGEYLTKLLGERAKVRHAKPITLPNDSEPEPDIAVVQRRGREYREHHPLPENIFWLIEYSNSSLEKDLEIKNKIYAEAGIKEYWVVNLKKSHLVVFREPLDGDYATKFTLTTETIQPLAFPDLAISVEQIINQ